MDRTTIMLPRELKMRLAMRAAELGISAGELIRRAVAQLLDRPDSKTAPSDPFLLDSAVFQGASPDDLALGHDDHLYGDEP